MFVLMVGHRDEQVGSYPLNPYRPSEVHHSFLHLARVNPEESIGSGNSFGSGSLVVGPVLGGFGVSQETGQFRLDVENVWVPEGDRCLTDVTGRESASELRLGPYPSLHGPVVADSKIVR